MQYAAVSSIHSALSPKRLPDWCVAQCHSSIDCSSKRNNDNEEKEINVGQICTDVPIQSSDGAIPIPPPNSCYAIAHRRWSSPIATKSYCLHMRRVWATVAINALLTTYPRSPRQH